MNLSDFRLNADCPKRLNIGGSFLYFLHSTAHMMVRGVHQRIDIGIEGAAVTLIEDGDPLATIRAMLAFWGI